MDMEMLIKKLLICLSNLPSAIPEKFLRMIFLILMINYHGLSKQQIETFDESFLFFCQIFILLVRWMYMKKHIFSEKTILSTVLFPKTEQ